MLAVGATLPCVAVLNLSALCLYSLALALLLRALLLLLCARVRALCLCALPVGCGACGL